MLPDQDEEGNTMYTIMPAFTGYEFDLLKSLSCAAVLSQFVYSMFERSSWYMSCINRCWHGYGSCNYNPLAPHPSLSRHVFICDSSIIYKQMSKTEKTPLHMAIAGNHFDLVSWLLENGANTGGVRMSAIRFWAPGNISKR